MKNSPFFDKYLFKRGAMIFCMLVYNEFNKPIWLFFGELTSLETGYASTNAASNALTSSLIYLSGASKGLTIPFNHILLICQASH